MAEKFTERLKNGWNAFKGEQKVFYQDVGPGYSINPSRRKIITGSERTIISSIYTRIAIDVASTTFEHAKTDENDRYKETVNSGLNDCLTLEANVDQSALDFKLDMAMSILDEGVIAVVPVDTVDNPTRGRAFEIRTLRVGKIIQWHPYHVQIRLYNERIGQYQNITMPKESVAIITNPFYSVMNEKNSTMSRLVYKLGLLDDADAKNNSGDLNMIVQLPYVVKSDTQRKRAETRRQSLEDQLSKSSHGIAYIDSTEKVTQLNRSVENNLLNQIDNLTKQLYSQLSIDETIMNGTANAETMNNYYQRTVSPIIESIKNEFNRKFLSKTARSQHQTVMAFQDPFKYMTVTQIAQMVDTLSRNEVLAPNEFRTALGFKPSEESGADELRNRNLIDPNADYGSSDSGYEDDYGDYQDNQSTNGSLLDARVNQLLGN